MTMSDLGQALMSVAILQYAVGPLIADLKRSHAASCGPAARNMHRHGPETDRLGSFFVALFSAPIYGGSGNAGSGIVSIRVGRIDGNVANFGLSLVLLLIGRLLTA